MSILTDEIVADFIEQKLQISDWKSKLEANRLNFLTEIVHAHELKIYYSNISWSAIPKPERKIPTIDEVIHYGRHGPGGTCIHMNYFLKLILVHLGYDAFVVGGETPLWLIPRSHMVTIVRFPPNSNNNNTEPEIYLVDIGFGGRPFLEPIPLHNLPYVGKAGGFFYEYRFNEEKAVYERILKDGCPIKGKFGLEKSDTVDFYFDLNRLDFDDFSECYHALFSPEGSSEFCDSLLLSRATLMNSLDDFEYVYFRNIHLIRGTKETYTETIFESYEALLPTVKQLFPNLDWQEVAKAFSHFTKARVAKLEARAEAAAAAASEENSQIVRLKFQI